MKIQIWEQNANFAISDSDSHFFHKCIKIAVGRIEQEICAYECTSHNADIRWVKVIAEMFGLDFDFVNRAGDCERSFPSAINYDFKGISESQTSLFPHQDRNRLCTAMRLWSWSVCSGTR